MNLHVYEDLEQGSDAWLSARCGIVTASVVGQLITATLKAADNETSRSLTRHLAAERITGYVEPSFENDDMRRGTLDEPYARDIYSEHYAPAHEVGFMVRNMDGMKLGYSPDGLVGDEGLIEVKSRRQKKHLQTILADEVPQENMAQIQAGLLVSGREWLDYVSYCGGMPLYVKRVLPDTKWHLAIIDAVEQFELSVLDIIRTYQQRTATLPTTKRIDHFADMEF